MPVRINMTDTEVTAYLSGEIDHHTAGEMRSEIDGAIERIQPLELILDFKDVTFMDSSGIGLVMGRYRMISPLGGKIKITGANSYITKVMRLAGLDKLANIDGWREKT